MEEIIDTQHWAALRIAGGYLLQAVQAVNTHMEGDLTRAVVLLGVMEANRQRLHGESVEARRPVSGGALADMLGIPAETVRRKVNTLLRDGYLVRQDGGLHLGHCALKRPEIARLVRANAVSMRRVSARMKRSTRKRAPLAEPIA